MATSVDADFVRSIFAAAAAQDLSCADRPEIILAPPGGWIASVWCAGPWGERALTLDETAIRIVSLHSLDSRMRRQRSRRGNSLVGPKRKVKLSALQF